VSATVADALDRAAELLAERGWTPTRTYGAHDPRMTVGQAIVAAVDALAGTGAATVDLLDAALNAAPTGAGEDAAEVIEAVRLAAREARRERPPLESRGHPVDATATPPGGRGRHQRPNPEVRSPTANRPEGGSLTWPG
jgi:hypothetical protein